MLLIVWSHKRYKLKAYSIVPCLLAKEKRIFAELWSNCIHYYYLLNTSLEILGGTIYLKVMNLISQYINEKHLIWEKYDHKLGLQFGLEIYTIVSSWKRKVHVLASTTVFILAGKARKLPSISPVVPPHLYRKPFSFGFELYSSFATAAVKLTGYHTSY